MNNYVSMHYFPKNKGIILYEILNFGVRSRCEKISVKSTVIDVVVSKICRQNTNCFYFFSTDLSKVKN